MAEKNNILFNMSSTYFIFPLCNYYFGMNKFKKLLDYCTSEVLQNDSDNKMKTFKFIPDITTTGVTVYGILTASDHKATHIIVLRGPQDYRLELPGGRVELGKSEIASLEQKLSKQLMPELQELKFKWKVGELVGVFYRPSYSDFVYPYLPTHVSNPKEILKLYFVQLPERCSFSILENCTIVAVPIFDFFNNATQWGNIFSSIPTILSRLNLVNVATRAHENTT